MKLLGLFFLGLILLQGCTLQGEPERDEDGVISSDRWENVSKRFDGTPHECLTEARKDFFITCFENYSQDVCDNIWDYTEVYTFILEEDGLQYCGMTLPKDYHIELI